MHVIPALSALPCAAGPAEASTARPAVAMPAPEPPAAPLQPSPKLMLDPALNLVVLEFRDAKGEVVNTIPSARELAAYRAGRQG